MQTQRLTLHQMKSTRNAKGKNKESGSVTYALRTRLKPVLIQRSRTKRSIVAAKSTSLVISGVNWWAGSSKQWTNRMRLLVLIEEALSQCQTLNPSSCAKRIKKTSRVESNARKSRKRAIMKENSTRNSSICKSVRAPRAGQGQSRRTKSEPLWSAS